MLNKIFNKDDNIDIINKKQRKDKKQIKTAKSKKEKNPNQNDEKEKIELLETQVKELTEKLHKLKELPPEFDFDKINLVDNRIEKKHDLLENNNIKYEKVNDEENNVEEEDNDEEVLKLNNSFHINSNDTTKNPILINQLNQLHGINNQEMKSSLDVVQTDNIEKAGILK